jgi:predicted small metal-binding protein
VKSKIMAMKKLREQPIQSKVVEKAWERHGMDKIAGNLKNLIICKSIF